MNRLKMSGFAAPGYEVLSFPSCIGHNRGGTGSEGPSRSKTGTRRKLSAAAIARIRAAQKARTEWSATWRSVPY
jgi:hypothetical protein